MEYTILILLLPLLSFLFLGLAGMKPGGHSVVWYVPIVLPIVLLSRISYVSFIINY